MRRNWQKKTTKHNGWHGLENFKYSDTCIFMNGFVFILGPNIHWTSNYGTGIVFIGNMFRG